MRTIDGPAISGTPLQDAFREVMGAVATPVAVVTTLEGARPFGSTVSAFASLSMDPPMVLVSLDRRSDLLAAVHRSRTFGLNVLGAAHRHWAQTFARKGGPGKFADVPWSLSEDLPRLPETSWIACDVTSIVPGGDHEVLLGRVRVAVAAGGDPLTYHRRGFGTHARHVD